MKHRSGEDTAIRRLRVRFNLLVWVGLLAVIAAVVIAINWINWRNLDQDAQASLEIRMEAEPGAMIQPPEQRSDAPGGTPPPLPERQEPGIARAQRGPSDRSRSMASLGSVCTVQLDADGTLLGWSSDRSDLYTEDGIRAQVSAIQALGRDSGRLGDQYFRIRRSPEGGATLLVLDARVEAESARGVLRITCFVGAAAWLLLSVLAFLLIRRMVRPVEEAFERQRQFVWDASHELKTPLAVISANADVLRREIGGNEWLGYNQGEVHRTDTLVQNLLTLARLERSGSELPMADFDLSRAVLEVALPFESTVFEAGKTLVTEIPEGIRCHGSADMIRQLLLILLSNALKYSDPHGVITLSLAARGEKRILRVHNTGEPIAPKDLPHLFDRFYRGDASHSSEVPGSGLGLAIAQRITEAHRGRIEVRSAAGEGTAFTVTL